MKLVAFAVSASLLVACAGDDGGSRPRSPRGDWRHQAPACTSDDQCNGGACVIADGQTRGTCAGGPGSGMGDPQLPPGHPRVPGKGDPDEPTVKPQPGDIQL